MSEDFIYRHIGPEQQEQNQMLKSLRCDNMSDLIEQVIPNTIRAQQYQPNVLPEGGISEVDLIEKLKQYAASSKRYHSMAGQGFHPTLMPAVIRRNMLEDPSWYSAYTPYQAEISQGRLEMLMNFQQMVQDFTGFECANASLLDEASAAAELMALFLRQKTIGNKNVFFASDQLQAPILDVMSNRAKSFGIDLRIGSLEQFNSCATQCYGALVPYFDSVGNINQLASYLQVAKENRICIAAQVDILALSVIEAPGKIGFDAAIGNTQRFGVPMAGGGPHAAYMACGMDWVRQLPGRIIGTSVDADGQLAYRMALQTREQHIRRERATSNICTAQALPANLAAAWAIYYGPQGIRLIATEVIRKKLILKQLLIDHGINVLTTNGFDTLSVPATSIQAMRVCDAGVLVHFADQKISISVNQLTTLEHINIILNGLLDKTITLKTESIAEQRIINESGDLFRQVDYLTHPIFNSKHSENKMMRYLKHLSNKDLALNSSMISLGSCTMKLNAAAIMEPISWPEIAEVHPLKLADSMLTPIVQDLQLWLAELTGFDTVSLQPNAGSQGELAGLMAIQRYHHSRGDTYRDICLIPSSAHGTNPASATLAGLKVRIINCDSHGNVSLPHLLETLNQIGDQISAIMITYPSTHGIFEEDIKAICDAVHAKGGMVYLDGANFNAMMGLVQPRYLGADVCHLNLHKTFCIPHGGGGPGVGPVCAIDALRPFLPTHRWDDADNIAGQRSELGTLTMAPEGNAGVLVISWGYIMLMGLKGLRHCAEVAILNANYTADQLSEFFPILYTNQQGRVAHECIIDIREITKRSKVTAEDIAKRLIDFGFHAPTMSFPVAGTLMIEPTESEDKAEVDRFCLAMGKIAAEIHAIDDGEMSIERSPLRNAPHTSIHLLTENWDQPYSKVQAAFPGSWQTTSNKYWPVVRRIDNVAGDRNLHCSCPPMESYMVESELQSNSN